MFVLHTKGTYGRPRTVTGIAYKNSYFYKNFLPSDTVLLQTVCEKIGLREPVRVTRKLGNTSVGHKRANEQLAARMNLNCVMYDLRCSR
jgi:hypothetical protein